MRRYSDHGADELVFYDITASFEGRKLFTDILTRVASTIFIPLTVGGGINTVADFDRVLKCGADKVSVNSGAIRNPDLIPQLIEAFGAERVTVAIDVDVNKNLPSGYEVYIDGGRTATGKDAVQR